MFARFFSSAWIVIDARERFLWDHWTVLAWFDATSVDGRCECTEHALKIARLPKRWISKFEETRKHAIVSAALEFKMVSTVDTEGLSPHSSGGRISTTLGSEKE